MIGPADIAATIRATWPPASVRRIGPFDVNDGAGGGNRVSAARLSDPLSDGGAVSPGEVSDVATAQAARGTEALFMVFGWQDPLDRLLAAEGYATRDETLILAAPAADIAEAPPPVSCFEIWPPLAVQEEIWAPAESARRGALSCAGPKVPRPPCSDGSTTVPPRPPSSRCMARTAMLHALEVASRARRQASPAS
jgi:hypothetical protein